MYCNQCGDRIEKDELYCNQCGNFLGYQEGICENNNYDRKIVNSKNNAKKVFLGFSIGFVIILLTTIFVVSVNSDKYYFSPDSYEKTPEESKQEQNPETIKKSKYITVIQSDNTYSNVKITNNEDANSLIVKDSVSQKKLCPKEIKEIENEIINTYGITAVNLCEMDVNFAKELLTVFDRIYTEYPSIRGDLTNISLINASLTESYIAAFSPIFNFATSDSSTSYPWVIKTQILLNTTYFLNTPRLESSVRDGSSTGHFPKNATAYSPVAHEFGHYLSFLAMMKKYNVDSILLIDEANINGLYDLYSDFAEGTYSLTMIEEAYTNYQKDNKTNLNLDQWRATISNYAVAKDNSGNYIYDETIAEAFHDVYLNGNKAQPASKYVVNVLKEKLEGQG